MKKYNMAIVGVTGVVGRMFLKVLAERKLPINKYYFFASQKSAGLAVEFLGKKHTVLELNAKNIKRKKIDYALFSAGGAVSGEFAPLFVKSGATVVDNSSFWRMEEGVPLVVPEVNADAIGKRNRIIANPNCTTIQAVAALAPLHNAFLLKRVIYSTYQAVSGAGKAGIDDLATGAKGERPKKFIYPIYNNVLPHIDAFMDDGYTKEEHKMINETKKILNALALRVSATTVRVPVVNGHSICINAEFEKKCTLKEVIEVLENAEGIVVCNKNNNYPMPLTVSGKDEVYVGRIRMDCTVESGVNLWVVADNIRKGAATNAVQIVEKLINKK